MDFLAPNYTPETEQAEQATLSCQECRRRKIKCGRKLPACDFCLGSALACVYPAGPLKPGPKPGSIRRAKKRRLLEPGNCHSPGMVDGGVSVSPMGAPYRIDPELRRSSLFPVRTGSSVHDSGRDCSTASNATSSPTVTGHSPEQSLMSHRRLSWLVHPNHEPTTTVESVVDEAVVESSALIQAGLMEEICRALRMDAHEVHDLINLYFENMLSFTLFTRRILAVKFQVALPAQSIALLAAMFSFSARFRTETEGNSSSGTATRFYLHAKRSIDEQLMDFRTPPPLLLLQAMVLLAFHDLIESAEGRGWRSLGPLVRIAYELRLHLIDSHGGDALTDTPELWSTKEERRRTWWAIWELDVFTSTVRRLPTAIDWNQNWTRLPVSDEVWAAKRPQNSCYLVADPTERFQLLEGCGNQSAKAWFIVANSIMRTAYCVSNSQEYFWTSPSFTPPRPGRRSLSEQLIGPGTVQSIYQVLRNAVYCLSLALPRHLRYRGQHLFTDVVAASKATKQRDSDIYSIHIMLRLTDFMVNHCHTPQSPAPGNKGQSQSQSQSPTSDSTTTPEEDDNGEGDSKTQYDRLFTKNIHMAETVVSLVRNSGPDHVQLVNPFLASTIWLAAAVLLVYKYLAVPHKSHSDEILVESNIKVLKTVFAQFVKGWEMSNILESKLAELESELISMRDGLGKSQQGERGVSSRAMDPLALVSGDNQAALFPEEAQVEIPPNPDALMGLPSLTRDGSVGSYELSSALFDGDFQYDMELQGFLDGMFATFRGQGT